MLRRSRFDQLDHRYALELNSTQLTDPSLKEIAKLGRIQSLQMDGTQVTDAGLEELTNVRTLFFVSAEHTGVTAAGAAELKKHLPNCRIGYK